MRSQILIVSVLFLSDRLALTSSWPDLIKYLAVVIRKWELVFCQIMILEGLNFDRKGRRIQSMTEVWNWKSGIARLGSWQIPFQGWIQHFILGSLWCQTLEESRKKWKKGLQSFEKLKDNSLPVSATSMNLCQLLKTTGSVLSKQSKSWVCVMATSWPPTGSLHWCRPDSESKNTIAGPTSRW